jgi:tetratricopeptide (TPR) repeat protein
MGNVPRSLMVRLSPKEKTKLRQYEELLAREPNALVFAPLASFYAREYDFAKAVDVLRRGLAVYPNYFSARVLLARCYIALDDFPAAVDELEKVLAADPYNISALGSLGDELRNRGRLAEARDHYLKILEIEPENEEYGYKLELLGTLVEGGPFARGPEVPAAEAESVVPPTPEPVSVVEVTPEPEPEPEPEPGPEPEPEPEAVRPTEAELPEAIPMPSAEVAPEPVETETFSLEELTVAEAEPFEEAAAAEEIATLTLAKIYEDQGLFVQAREVLDKVLAREPDNASARDALAHVDALIAGADSPTGASVIQLIHKVEAVSGILESDELELWEEASAGVEEALAGFEEITLAQAVAAAAGLKSVDSFVLQDDKRAFWEVDVAGVARAAGEGGADELAYELPLFTHLDLPEGVNVAELAAEGSPGTSGMDEFDVAPGAVATAGVDSFEVGGTVAAEAGAAGAEEVVVDLKAEIRGEKPARPPETEVPPAEAEEPERPDEFAVKPERYQAKKPLELEGEPFERDEDFLGWLDSIRLKEL